jgi:hypothetical protein
MMVRFLKMKSISSIDVQWAGLESLQPLHPMFRNPVKAGTENLVFGVIIIFPDLRR